jgi:hypothetical protein
MADAKRDDERIDESLGGDYARDTHRGGLGGDYARDDHDYGDRGVKHDHSEEPIGKASE